MRTIARHQAAHWHLGDVPSGSSAAGSDGDVHHLAAGAGVGWQPAGCSHSTAHEPRGHWTMAVDITDTKTRPGRPKAPRMLHGKRCRCCSRACDYDLLSNYFYLRCPACSHTTLPSPLVCPHSPADSCANLLWIASMMSPTLNACPAAKCRPMMRPDSTRTAAPGQHHTTVTTQTAQGRVRVPDSISHDRARLCASLESLPV